MKTSYKDVSVGDRFKISSEKPDIYRVTSVDEKLLEAEYVGNSQGDSDGIERSILLNSQVIPTLRWL